MLMDVSFNLCFFLVSLQLNVASNILYDGGLNFYALYLDCEGGRKLNRGYERSMTNLFRNYRTQPNTFKVSVSLCEQGEQVLLTRTTVYFLIEWLSHVLSGGPHGTLFRGGTVVSGERQVIF